MRPSRGGNISVHKSWEGFRMRNRFLELPTGESVTPQEVLTGIALLEINSDIELKTTAKILKYSRAISKLLARR